MNLRREVMWYKEPLNTLEELWMVVCVVITVEHIIYTGPSCNPNIIS